MKCSGKINVDKTKNVEIAHKSGSKKSLQEINWELNFYMAVKQTAAAAAALS